MSGYLIEVTYEVLGVSKVASIGVEDALFPDEASALSHAISAVTSYRTMKGDTLSNVSATVIEVR